MMKTKVKIGSKIVLGDGHICIQSMLNKRSDDIAGNVEQAVALEKAGCEILRVAIPNMEAVKLISAIKNSVNIPLVADIHFDYKLALASIDAGIDKIRINPGNIGKIERVEMIVKSCKSRNIPIRIGVNSGSLPESTRKMPISERFIDAARSHIEILERLGFHDIVLSMKSTDLKTSLSVYRMASEIFRYPLHIGITEAGIPKFGILKSAIGIGSLLLDGIGDTIRVSLTADPIEEVYAAKDILATLGLTDNVRIISCPTCGRTRINVEKIASELAEATSMMHKKLTVAVMGCVVNGPGEARDADIGYAGGAGEGVLFRKGKVIEKISEADIVKVLIDEINIL